MSKEYDKNQNTVLNEKLKQLCIKLPDFTALFFRGIADQTQIKTRIAYAYDLRIFFYYLLTDNDKFKTRSSETDFTLSDIDSINPVDIEQFSTFLNYYKLPHYKNPDVMIPYTNTANGKMRKLSTLRSFYNYFYKKQMIKTNPALLVDLPKLKEKEIIRLEPNEVADLLDTVETGKGLTNTQMKYHTRNEKRDMAIIALLVGTGIRISECVGLNISDFDFNNNSFTVTRKGGDRTILYLPEEVKEIIVDYLENVRNNQTAADDFDMDPLFLSIAKKRLLVGGIQRMLAKYSTMAVPLKHISPHKLRSTFGTNLYRETGDIYLVADVLGHKDVNTTKKHYAAIDVERRKIAAQKTKLRK